MWMIRRDTGRSQGIHFDELVVGDEVHVEVWMLGKFVGRMTIDLELWVEVINTLLVSNPRITRGHCQYECMHRAHLGEPCLAAYVDIDGGERACGCMAGESYPTS
jgi:hypothetical protein